MISPRDLLKRFAVPFDKLRAGVVSVSKSQPKRNRSQTSATCDLIAGTVLVPIPYARALLADR